MIVSLLVIGIVFANETELTNEKLPAYGAIVCGAETCIDNQVKMIRIILVNS